MTKDNRPDYDFDDDTYDGPSWEKRSRRRNDRRSTKRELRNLNWNNLEDPSEYYEEEDTWEKFDGNNS